ncbi:MAG TPA: thiamine phosphate synthase [Candidatus Eremiobacteraceae bacterium]|nr:thiamine phosphate synthase [Candidatus Eremiobacteraceae bacterium]
MRSEELAGVELYLVTDASPRVPDLQRFLIAAIDAGVDMVQLRDRSLTDGRLLETARFFAEVCRDNGALFIVNDRPDIALACGADGVHLGQDDLPPDDVRALVGDDFIIGLSTHSPAQVDAAVRTRADYIAVGPVHETPTKPGRPAVGLDLVRYAAANVRVPFFAIGGIDASNVGSVAQAGAKAVAVLRAISQADDPAAATAKLLASLRSNRTPAVRS